MTSPAGTRIPRDGSSLVDALGVTWTIDSSGWSRCNGFRTNGHASAIDWDGTAVRVLSPTGGMWWAAPQIHSLVLKWTPLSTVDPDPGSAPAWPPLTLPGPIDFNTRKSAAGVVRYFDFNSPAQLGGDYSANFGTIPGTSANPVIDPLVTCEGLSTLRFDIPSLSGANAGGNWFANFSPDLLTQFGAGDTFYVQVRTKWNQALFDTVFMAESLDPTGKPIPGTQPTAIKLFDVNFGDEPGSPIIHHYSSAGGKIVVCTRYQCRFPWLYAYDSNGDSTPFEEPIGPPFDFKEQNAMPAPFCLYSNATGKSGPIAGCFNIFANEWMTWQLGVTLGPLGTDKNGFPVWTQSRVRLWGARDGQPSQLLVDWNPSVPGYYDRRAVDDDKTKPLKIGKVWAFPYMTAKDTTQVHPLAQAWYGPIIISTQPIADPALTQPSEPTMPTSPTNLQASDALPDRVTVTWGASTVALSYDVYRSTDPAQLGAKVGTTTSLSYDDLTAVPGVQYYYSAVANNDAGPSAPSNSDAGEVPAVVTAPPPTGFWATPPPLMTYTEIPNTAMATTISPLLDAMGYSDIGGGTNALSCEKIMYTWSGSANDLILGEMNLTGSAHNDSANAMFTKFGIETQKWRLLVPPSQYNAADLATAQAAWNAAGMTWQGYSQGWNLTDTWKDGKRTALHTYDSLIVVGNDIIVPGLLHFWHIDKNTGAQTQGAALPWTWWTNNWYSTFDEVTGYVVIFGVVHSGYWSILQYDPVAKVLMAQRSFAVAKANGTGNVTSSQDDWVAMCSRNGRTIMCYSLGNSTAWTLNLDQLPAGNLLGAEVVLSGSWPAAPLWTQTFVPPLGGTVFMLANGQLGLLNWTTGVKSVLSVANMPAAPVAPYNNGQFGRWYWYPARNSIISIPKAASNVGVIRFA